MKISRTEQPGRASRPNRGPDGPWGRRGVPKGSEHQSWTDLGQSVDPSDDCKVRAALEGTHVFSAKIDIREMSPIFWLYCNSPNRYAHSNCIEILCKGVGSIPKVTLPMPKPISMRHHR